MPSNTVSRQVHRHNIHDAERRYYSRMPFFEGKIDPEKERRSILMARWPARRSKPDNGCEMDKNHG